MNLRQLTTFQTAAETLSFTRTAAIHNYAQSSVSTQITNLEAEIGGPLFNRIGRKLTLTEKGRQLLTYTTRILDLVEETKRVVGEQTEPQGALTLAAPETLCAYRMPPIIQRFRALYPAVSLRILPLPSAEGAWQTMLEQGEAAAALRIGEPVADASFHVETLITEPLCIVVHATHPLANQLNVTPAQIANETLLLTERDCTYRRLFEIELRRLALTPQSKIEFHAVEAIKQCALGGMGIAILPKITIAQQLAAQQFKRLPWPATLTVATQLIWDKQRPQSAALQALLHVMQQAIKN